VYDVVDAMLWYHRSNQLGHTDAQITLTAIKKANEKLLKKN
jgi:hypothetical protein